MLRRYKLLIATLVFLSPFAARGGDIAKPGPNSDTEPMAERFSLERGARFLDTVSVDLDEGPEVRDLPHQLRPHDGRAGGREARFARAGGGAGLLRVASRWLGQARKVRATHRGRREIVAIAAALALYDAASTGQLHPRDPHSTRPHVDDPAAGWRLEVVRLRPATDGGRRLLRDRPGGRRCRACPGRLQVHRCRPEGHREAPRIPPRHTGPQSPPPGDVAMGVDGPRRTDGRRESASGRWPNCWPSSARTAAGA